jgi:hypothetical protein
MRLFSNLNLNMVNRLDKFKESRIIAVNSPGGTPIDPVGFLDYSPYRTITVPGGGTITDPFLPGDYEDERFCEAERLFEESNDLTQITIPYLAARAYGYLGGDANNSDAYIEANVDELDLRNALADCEEMELARAKAYNNFFEDMNGVDSDYDSFVGGVGLLQQVYDDPKVPGLYDPNPADDPAAYGLTSSDTEALAAIKTRNDRNRLKLQQIITKITNTQEAMDNLLYNATKPYGVLRPEVNSSRYHLNIALNAWQRWQFAKNFVRPGCYCDGPSCHECCVGEYCGGCSQPGCWLYFDDPDTPAVEAEVIYGANLTDEWGNIIRTSSYDSFLAEFIAAIRRTDQYKTFYQYADTAKNALKRIIQYASDIYVVPPELQSNLSSKGDELVGLVSLTATRNNIVRAVQICQDMLDIIAVEEAREYDPPPDPVPDYTYLKNLISQIKSALSSALADWSDTVLRGRFLAGALSKIDRLKEVLALR